MGRVKENLLDFKEGLKDRHMFTIIIVLITIIVGLGVYTYKKQTEYKQVAENNYNMAFFEVVDYIKNMENYLAKAMITSTPEHSAEMLTKIWKESNLALAYLSRLPMNSNELSNTAKFLNQVSEYTYSLSIKNIYDEELTEEEFEKLKQLHDYSVELANILNQLSTEIIDGTVSWGELERKGTPVFAQQVSNLSRRQL